MVSFPGSGWTLSRTLMREQAFEPLRVFRHSYFAFPKPSVSLTRKTSGMIQGLTSGTKYVFKAVATSPEANKIGLYNFTEPVEKFVQ